MEPKKEQGYLRIFSKYLFSFEEKEPYLEFLAQYLLEKFLEGNICVRRERILEEGKEGLDKEEIEKISRIFQGKLSKKEEKYFHFIDGYKNPLPFKPFIIEEGKLYFHRYYVYETKLLEEIKRIIEGEEDIGEEKWQELKSFFQNYLSSVGEKGLLTPDVRQLVGALGGLFYNFFIITGGPGTGKTFTIGLFLYFYLSLFPEKKVSLCAPTGKAAVRMKVSLKNFFQKNEALFSKEIKEKIAGLNASTIHKLLGYKHQSIFFQHNRSYPLPADLIIVDEASMIDLSLLEKLLEAVKDGGKILLLGDKNQLSSVEAGSIFGDLCESQSDNWNQLERKFGEKLAEILPQKDLKEFSLSSSRNNLLSGRVVELTKTFRFQGELAQLSRLIINGRVDELKDFLANLSSSSSLRFLPLQNKYFYDDLREDYRLYLESPPSQKLDVFLNLTVLSPVKKGEWGVYGLNEKVEKLFLELKENFRLKEPFYPEEALLVTKNDYYLGLFNGDIGVVIEEGGKLFFNYYSYAEENIVARQIPVTLLSHYEKAYALTVHKSQGSEYPKVVLVIPNYENRLLTRELIYTAVTRAKSHLTILGEWEHLKAGIERRIERISGLKERIKGWC